MDVITPALRVSSILRRTRPDVMMPIANNSQNALRISDWTRNIKIDVFGFRNESAPKRALPSTVHAFHEEFRQFAFVGSIVKVCEACLLAGCANFFGTARVPQHADHLLRKIKLIARL